MPHTEYKKLPPDLVKKLEDIRRKRPDYQQVEKLVLLIDELRKLDKTTAKLDSKESFNKINIALKGIDKLVSELNKKEIKFPPDKTSEITDALKKVETAIGKIKTEVKVTPPKVNVPSVKIDLKEVAKAVKSLESSLDFNFPSAMGSEILGVYLGDKSVVPQYAPIDIFERGENKIIESKKVRVLSCFLMASESTQIRFADDKGHLSGLITLMPSTGFVLPYNQAGWFESNSLDIEQTQHVNLGGFLTFIEV